MSSDSPSPAPGIGLYAGAVTYLWWGLAPLYWRALGAVAPIDVIAHRALWAVPFCALLLAVRGQLRPALALLRQPRLVGLLALSSAMVALNWGIYIYAVSRHQVAEASLGYFLLPLLSVLSGLLFFGERLRPVQWLAVGFAAAGVAVYAVRIGTPPTIALALAVCFAMYGALRKRVPVGSLDGLFVETLLLAPPALGWILWHDGAGLGRHGPATDALLLLSGAFTALPLILYVVAAQRLSMVTLGLLFYLNPSCQLLLAVCWFGEPLYAGQAWTFVLVWIGVLLYLAQMGRDRWRARRLPRVDAG